MRKQYDATELVGDWATRYQKELYERHDGSRDNMLIEACRQAMSYKWALTWISGHSSEVANLQGYARLALGEMRDA